MASLASPIGYAMFSHAPSGGMAEYILEKAAANKSLSHHLPADSLQTPCREGGTPIDGMPRARYHSPTRLKRSSDRDDPFQNRRISQVLPARTRFPNVLGNGPPHAYGRGESRRCVVLPATPEQCSDDGMADDSRYLSIREHHGVRRTSRSNAPTLSGITDGFQGPHPGTSSLLHE